MKYALVSDFDGTITAEDFFTLASRKWFDEKMLAPWRDYLAGNRTHFAALRLMFSQIRVPEEELQKFIRKMDYDRDFFKLAAFCQRRKIPVYICSAGCGYYIRELVGPQMEKYGVKLVANRGVYSKKMGLQMLSTRRDSHYYDPADGISKKALVEELKEKGCEVIFAGDGPPDIKPAKAADIVFAHKFLFDECKKAGISAHKFAGFKNVLEFMEKL